MVINDKRHKQRRRVFKVSKKPVFYLSCVCGLFLSFLFAENLNTVRHFQFIQSYLNPELFFCLFAHIVFLILSVHVTLTFLLMKTTYLQKKKKCHD